MIQRQTAPHDFKSALLNLNHGRLFGGESFLPRLCLLWNSNQKIPNNLPPYFPVNYDHCMAFTRTNNLLCSPSQLSNVHFKSCATLTSALVCLDSTAVSIFVVILVELTNTVFVNSTNITTNIETAALSTGEGIHRDADLFSEKGFV